MAFTKDKKPAVLCLLLFAAMASALLACPAEKDPSSSADAAVSDTTGRVSGNISSSVTDCPALSANDDCVGTLYVGIFSDASRSSDGLVAAASLTEVDLSNGGSVAYTVEDLAPGSWYLAAFLDDDGNADAAQPQPGEGDLVGNFGSIAISIEVGESTIADQELSIRLPLSTSTVCENVRCSDHGECFDQNGSAQCNCDDGFVASGRYCFEIDPQPPTDFTCPSPGDLSDSLSTQLLSGRWYYAANDRTCSVSSWFLYEFREDGTFWIRWQNDLEQVVGQSFEYGCWSLTDSSATRLTLAYDYASTNSLNCLALGQMSDPPCSAVLEYVDDDNWFQGASFDLSSEKHVFRRTGLSSCDWCSDDDACCPDYGWTEDGGAAVCP